LLGAGAAARSAKLFHLATAQLVFDFGGLAKVHEFLQRRLYEILGELEAADPNDERAVRKWSAKLLAITADEPMTMRALDAIAYNKALDALVSPAEKARALASGHSSQSTFRHG
jgi:hypothetical protein